MQKYDLTALKLLLQVPQERLYDTLTSKSIFIKEKKQEDITPAFRARLNYEEEHISICLAYMDAVKDYLEALENEVRCKNRIISFLQSESTEYLNKYYDAVDKSAEYNLVKELTKK